MPTSLAIIPNITYSTLSSSTVSRRKQTFIKDIMKLNEPFTPTSEEIYFQIFPLSSAIIMSSFSTKYYEKCELYYKEILYVCLQEIYLRNVM